MLVLRYPKARSGSQCGAVYAWWSHSTPCPTKWPSTKRQTASAESDGKHGLALPRVIERTLDRHQPVAAVEQRQPVRYLSALDIHGYLPLACPQDNTLMHPVASRKGGPRRRETPQQDGAVPRPGPPCLPPG